MQGWRKRAANGRWLAAMGVVLMAAQVCGGLPATGPLRVAAENPRYFSDPNGRIIYLTGSHTWNNLKDMGPTDPPAPFDWPGYLDFLTTHHHNFIRLWTWELTRYGYDAKTTYAGPFPWRRTGPGNALDGQPKFDLTKFDDAYFTRLRSRVAEAGERGIYVSVMLFEGHGLHGSDKPWCWNGHPFCKDNNVNGIDGDPNGDGRGLEYQTLDVPGIWPLQENYVRRVIEAVGDLDNVLYEVTNESGAYSTEWQYKVIRLVKDEEKKRLKQHPVGMTFQYCRDKTQRGTNQALFDSPADWISPSPDDGYRDAPPAADGRKVIITDTDHLWGIGGDDIWVWKAFCRGQNPIFMDPYHQAPDGGTSKTWTDHLGQPRKTDPKWDPIRLAMGRTLDLAKRLDLRKAEPHPELASSRYCLAEPGHYYLVYSPAGGTITVDLRNAVGDVTASWHHPVSGDDPPQFSVEGGERQQLEAPFEGPVVLLLLADG